MKYKQSENDIKSQIFWDYALLGGDKYTLDDFLKLSIRDCNVILKKRDKEVALKNLNELISKNRSTYIDK